MRMDIAPRDAPTRRSGGIVSSLRRWNPTKTPKTTATLTLYLFGLFVAFVARPPVTITDQMQTRYFEMMDTADAVDAAPRAAGATTPPVTGKRKNRTGKNSKKLLKHLRTVAEVAHADDLL